MNVTKEHIEEVLTALSDRANSELLALSADEIAAKWHWNWDDGSSIEWNTYHFSRELEAYKRRCRKWEEHHNGPCCVVERVRDKYVMPRVREFIKELQRKLE